MSPVQIRKNPMSFLDYSKRALASNQLSLLEEDKQLETLKYGFFGEIGSFLSSIKKSIRESSISDLDVGFSAEELGDALWYLFAISSCLKITPKSLGKACIEKLHQGTDNDNSYDSPSFRHIDGIIDFSYEGKIPGLDVQCHQIAVITSKLMDLKKTDKNKTETLASIFREITLTAACLNTSMQSIAEENLKKTESRWPGKNKEYIHFFDEGYPEVEQFPRTLKFVFEEREIKGKKYALISLNDVYLGSRLTDNKHEQDDYRFHDVFHIAYIVFLGWSPVIRALLKRKRKSVPSVDENEDGARAIIMEEGIATWIFNHAAKRNFYAGVETGRIEYSVLKQIQSLIEGYEVEKCPLWQWEEAILNGFQVFRGLHEHRSGTVTADLNNRTLTFTPSGK